MSELSTSFILDLRYRRVVYRLFYIVIGFCTVSLLFIIRQNILKLATEDWYVVTLKLIVAGSLPLTVLIRSLFFFAPRLYSRYRADAAKLMVESRGQSREIFYDQIDRIKISKLSPRLLGGFRLRLKSGSKLRFPTLMTNTATLLQMIHRARPELISHDDFEKFYHTSRLVEISWARIKDKFKRWQPLLIKYVLYPLAIAFLFHTRGYSIGVNRHAFENIFFWFSIGFSLHLFIAAVLNHFEEKINNTHLLQLSSLERDQEYERKIETGSHVLFYLLTASVALFTLYGR